MEKRRLVLTPDCVVARGGRVSLTPNGWLAWRPDPTVPSRPLPDEWIFRGLQEGDLTDPAWMLAILTRRGMVWRRYDAFRDDETTPPELALPRLPPVDDATATVHLSEAYEHLTALRGAVNEWLGHQVSGAPLTPWFRRVIHAGMAVFPLDDIALNPQPFAVDLFEAGTLQLFAAMLDYAPLKYCQNETCRRPFYRKQDGNHYGYRQTVGLRYCSRSCANAQNQRVYRRRVSARTR